MKLTSQELEAIENKIITMLETGDSGVSDSTLERFAKHCVAVRTSLIRIEGQQRIAHRGKEARSHEASDDRSI